MNAEPNEELKNIVALYKTAMSLKELPRQGWIMEGALRTETDTVAAHSFCVAVISYFTASALVRDFPNVNVAKATVMGIFHDLSESATGEIATAIKRWIANDAQADLVEKMEHALLNALLKDTVGGEKLQELVVEFDRCASKEARIVKFADALDAFAHARVRLRKTFPGYLERIREKLCSGSSDDSNEQLGKLLAQWLEQVEENWDNPGWEMKRPWSEGR